MSADCYLIGIGGSGSKCVDNYTYMCASGLGPEELWMGIVDQDQPNGNLAKAKKNITNYQSLYKKFRSEGQNNILSKSNLFKTNIRSKENTLDWAPIDETAIPNLKELFEYDILNDDLKHLMECLYHSEKDLNLSLKEGFRGRPSIGTAAMIARMKEDAPFWQNIFDSLDGVSQGKEIRIFLVSSVFGGTGASGFPSIARLIRAILKQKGITDNVYIGGSLLLPYFSFPKPEDETDRDESALSDAFLQQSRGALNYYYRLFKDEKVFDELYLTGWDPLIQLNYFDSGGTGQNNPPLMPELYSCLSASEFFIKDKIDSEDESAVYYTSRNKDNEFTWSDIPTLNNNKNEVKNLIGQFTRTAVSFKYDWFNTLSKTSSAEKGTAWYSSLIKSKVDLNSANTKQFIDEINLYFENYLLWLSSLINHSESNINDKIDLIETNQFSTFDAEKLKTGVELTTKQSGSENIQKLVSDSNCNSSDRIFEIMSEYKANKELSGLGIFMNALFDSCETKDGK